MLVRCSENFKAVLRVKKEWIEVFIKKKPLVNFEFTRVECGRWDLNEFPHTVNSHRKELSAHQLIKCNQKCNQLVNCLFFLKEKICEANSLQVLTKDNCDRGC